MYLEHRVRECVRGTPVDVMFLRRSRSDGHEGMCRETRALDSIRNITRTRVMFLIQRSDVKERVRM